MAWKVPLLLVVVLAYWTYFLYIPMPDGVAEPWKHSALMAVLKIMNKLGKIQELIGYDSSVNISRAIMRRLSHGVDIGKVEIEDTVFDSVKVRLYRPKGNEGVLPGLAYYHGGGWALGDPATCDELVGKVTEEAGVFIMSVDYRLAPEHQYPAAFDDCVLATEYLIKNAEKLGVDPKRIGVAGDSSGGNLATAVALKLSKSDDVKLHKVRLMALIYPALQPFDFQTPSYVQYGTNDGTYMLSKTMMIKYWLWYAQGNLQDFQELLQNNHATDELTNSKYGRYISYDLLPEEFFKLATKPPPNYAEKNKTLFRRLKGIFTDMYFSPLMASDEDLKLLPQTYILTAEFDILRDEGCMFAKRLENNGVNVSHSHWSKNLHAFLSLTSILNNANLAVSEFSEYLKNNL